jgi:signal transduction histidine kinase
MMSRAPRDIHILLACADDRVISKIMSLAGNIAQMTLHVDVVGDKAHMRHFFEGDQEVQLVFLSDNAGVGFGGAALDYCTQEHPDLPVVMLAGRMDEAGEESLLLQGAQDVLQPLRLTPGGLARVVWRAVERHQILRKSEVLKENVTLLREVQSVNEQLKKKNQEIMQFYQTVSHELKTPLTSIASFASILSDGIAGAVNPKQREYLDIIEKNTKQLTVYVNDLLTISRMETAKYDLVCKAVNLSELIDYVIKILVSKADEKRIKLVYKSDKEHIVFVDEARIIEVLTNLVSNAIKYTNELGCIILRARPSKKATGLWA